MNGPHWNGDHDRMNDGQVEQHRHALKWQTDAQLRHSYRTYLDGLMLNEDGLPPRASKLQYFIETWRELRRRYR